MDTDTRTQPQAPQVASEARSRFGALHSLVTELITGGQPDPDNPQPPGPADPVIRKALSRFEDRMGHGVPWIVFGPHPEPWRGVFGPQPDPWRLTAILVAEEVVDHVSRLQDIADIAGQSGSPAQDYMARFVDDIELCPPWRKWPFPPPKRGETLFDPVDIVTMGVAFTHLAETVPDERLRGDIQGMGARLMEKGAARL
jgi:hypothetical protein